MIFKKPSDTNNELSYPVDQSQIYSLDNSSYVSPRVGKTNDVKIPSDFDIESATKEVVDVRLEVGNNKIPNDYFDAHWPFAFERPAELPQPLKNEGLSFNNLRSLANVVHMDSPIDVHLAVLGWLTSGGVKLKNQETSFKPFLQVIPNSIKVISEYVAEGLEKGFETKYFYGLARPEENVKTFCPSIDADDLTQYSEGCPNHPSFPAGHGSAAGAGAKAVIDLFDLTENQLEVVLTTAFYWSHFRTLAGVHFGIDNNAGLIIGGLGEYFTDEFRTKFEA